MADSNPSALHSSAKTEFACPDCGEMVREGLVRCWNCGGFLRPEMEQKFQKMQEQPPKPILSVSHEPDADDADLDTMMKSRTSQASDDDDFQISTPVKQVAAPTIDAGEAATEAPAQDAEADAGSTKETGADESAASASERKDSGTGEDAADSVAAGGDALMELAAAEEQERDRKQGSRPASLEGVRVIRDGFLIDAPKGCRIQVRDEKTGELRRLTFGASSRVRISMLDKLEAIAKAKKEAGEKQAAGPQYLSAGKYQRWMCDLHLHTINPAKLKLVADSLTKEFAAVDLGFADDTLLIVSLPVAKKGLFGGGKGPESPEAAREALLQHLRGGKSLDSDKVEVAGDIKSKYTADQVAELRVVQPVASLSDSLFAGIPVFGQGRIAVQLPVLEAGEQPKVLSFTLSQFREFIDIVGPMYSMTEFGHNLGIPLVDSFEELKCHFTGDAFKALEHVEFYDADPALETVLAGFKCEACGIAVSEDAREKEKLGGKAAKGIAKAKCPKCEQKMGNVPLYTLASAATETSMQGDASAAGDEDSAEPADDKPVDDSASGAANTADDSAEQGGASAEAASGDEAKS